MGDDAATSQSELTGLCKAERTAEVIQPRGVATKGQRQQVAAKGALLLTLSLRVKGGVDK